MLPDIVDPVWVDTPDALMTMFQEIKNAPQLAVDTESNSLFAYQEEVCLIQVSTPQRDYLIDPLALDDLSALAPIFSNPAQRKIFHACEYDLICLKRDFHFEVNNIFDTMIAARILGEKQVGLGNLLNAHFGILLDKRYQRANWGIRPLSAEMLDYARMDTHHLFKLQEFIEESLKQAGLWQLALEDFALISETEPHPLENNNISCWKVAGAAHITPRQAAVLQELCFYRDLQAQKMNLPHFKVLSNDLLLELCLEPPHTSDELRAYPGVTERLLQRHEAGLLAAIERGEKAAPINRQPRTHAEPKYMKQLELLRDWRKEKALLLKVESDVVLPRETMEKIAACAPRNLTELQGAMQKTPWRFKKYGKLILKALKTEEKK